MSSMKMPSVSFRTDLDYVVVYSLKSVKAVGIKMQS